MSSGEDHHEPCRVGTAYLDVQSEVFAPWVVQQLTNDFFAHVISIGLASALAAKLCLRMGTQLAQPRYKVWTASQVLPLQIPDRRSAGL
jgi:hypothetical protein